MLLFIILSEFLILLMLFVLDEKFLEYKVWLVLACMVRLVISRLVIDILVK